MNFNRTYVGNAVALLAGATLVLTTGIAAGQAASSSPSYTACVSKKNVLTPANKGKCPKGTRSVKIKGKGDRGPTGATGATGAAGTQGVTGPPGPFPTTLPSGKTIVGTFGAEAATGYAGTNISFVYPLAAALAPNNVETVSTSGGGAHCPGTADAPTAARGYLCLYLSYSLNLHNVQTESLSNIGAFGTGTTGAEVSGVPLVYGNPVQIDGTWALTAA